MRFMNKHTPWQESNTHALSIVFVSWKQSCCGGDITASYLQVLYPGRGEDGLRESFNGDFSCFIIENILLDYQV